MPELVAGVHVGNMWGDVSMYYRTDNSDLIVKYNLHGLPTNGCQAWGADLDITYGNWRKC